jgi:heterotetrameric sarcosine oxidase alpha subunit
LSQLYRSSKGGLIDRGRTLTFRFDDRRLGGHPGDSLASALLANGVRLVGRSFKYHRPRGVLSAGAEEPNALVELRRDARREPNTRATVVELFDGLAASSQNRWPSLRWDVLSLNGLIAPLLPAGFYYKTFFGSARKWTRFYEPLIRRAAGLGRAPEASDPDSYETQHAHCDILVVGGGLSGLMAAHVAAVAGARAIICNDDFAWGGHALSEEAQIDGRDVQSWIEQIQGDLAAAPTVRLLPRTTVFGWYDGNSFAAVERASDHLREPAPGEPRQRLWQIAARHVVLAPGAQERPLVFGGNDLPGVMLSSAARLYARRWAVRAGDHAVVAGGEESVEATVRCLSDIGVSIEAVVDARDKALSISALGGRQLRAVEVNGRKIDCDLLCMSGGWLPSVHLLSQRGHKPEWRDSLGSFLPDQLSGDTFTVCGRAAALFTVEQRLESGAAAGRRALERLGSSRHVTRYSCADVNGQAHPESIRRLPGRGKAFVDFQNDVTAEDVELAAREGYSSVELLKRYTTLGMGTEQGKTSNVNGLALLAQGTNRSISEVGTTTFRPPYTPVALGALAGEFVGQSWRPTRRTPFHAWAEHRGARFVESGLWLRTQCFPLGNESIAEAAYREALAVRSSVGVCDISTLGKFVLQGPDARTFLNRVYANRFDRLPIGKVRYALLLREDGIVMDDGTVTRLGQDRYFLTVTSSGAQHAFEHLTYYAEVVWPEFDLQLSDVTEDLGALAVAGPHARQLLARTLPHFDLSNEHFPFLAAAEAVGFGDQRILLLRVSFSGELGYEIYVPSRSADRIISALEAKGDDIRPVLYGVEALGILRIEKGFVAGSEINGATTPRQLNLDGLVARDKDDFVGKALLDRSGLLDPRERPQIVGLRAVDPNENIIAGAHIFEPDAPRTAARGLGYVTTATWSPTLQAPIALALLSEAKERIGQRLVACSPVHGVETPVFACDPVFYDGEGHRVRS